jgi:hypothetical protein
VSRLKGFEPAVIQNRPDVCEARPSLVPVVACGGSRSGHMIAMRAGQDM